MNATEIRRGMIDKGFSFTEIYEMLGKVKNNPTGNLRRKRKKFDYFDYMEVQQFERGGCLSAWLGLNIVGGILVTLAIMFLLVSGGFAGIEFIAFIAFIAIIVGGGCIRKWGRDRVK